MKNNTYDGYQQLAVAIIGQAVEDYTWAICTLKKFKIVAPQTKREISEKQLAEREIIDCEKFFRSDWFDTLSSNDLDGESLISAIRKEMYKKPRVIKRMESK
jgi:hypothetical protein